MQTQVLPYLRQLKKGANASDRLQVSILTFEPNVAFDSTSIQKELAEEGIDWHWLPYHKRFSVIATAWDIIRGTIFVTRFISREQPAVLHCRIHVPATIGALARKLARHKPRLLFDIRGFFPEEYTDAGVWPKDGLIYRSVKRVERWLMKESDGFVVLTEKARSILFSESQSTGVDKLGRPVEVIPCCVDLQRFSIVNPGSRELMRGELGVNGRKVVTYVGSFGGWYLTDEMMDFFSAVAEYDPTTFVMILTQRDQDKVIEKLKARGFSPGDYFVASVAPSELPRYLSAADVALSFIKACYSKQSSSPTKIAEYLASGLPIIANQGVGDVDALIQENSVGAITTIFSSASYKDAFARVQALGNISDRCRNTAQAEFDLESVGGERYRRLYDRLLSGRNTGK